MRRKLKFSSGINLIPFDINIVNEQVLYNILLTVPFGFGLPFLLNVTKIRLMIYGVSFCVVIESLQLIISLFLGFPYRTIDINDVILNVFGVILGFMIFKVFGFLFKKMVNNLDIKKSPFRAFFVVRIPCIRCTFTFTKLSIPHRKVGANAFWTVWGHVEKVV
ncbi:VanZ family protein [Calditerricola satsumensis]